MSGRFFLVSGALLLLVANIAFGDGVYQHTRNGKTLVWNNYPKRGDEATWSGRRDAEGYAHGFGTLTWYTVEQSETGSAEPVLYARYWGYMVRGKFNGPVNVHSRGETDHSLFVDGVRTMRWVAGAAPYRIARSQITEARQKALLVKKAKNIQPALAVDGLRRGERPMSNVQPPTRETEAEAPAEGPLIQRSEGGGQSPPGSAQLSTSSARPPTIAGHRRIEIDDSIRLLVYPPRFLRMRSSPTNNMRLTKENVLNLADAVARARGYDPAEYEHSDPQYDPTYKTWSVMYDQKPIDGTAGIGKHFSVAVSDETKATALVMGE